MSWVKSLAVVMAKSYLVRIQGLSFIVNHERYRCTYSRYGSTCCQFLAALIYKKYCTRKKLSNLMIAILFEKLHTNRFTAEPEFFSPFSARLLLTQRSPPAEPKWIRRNAVNVSVLLICIYYSISFPPRLNRKASRGPFHFSIIPRLHS